MKFALKRKLKLIKVGAITAFCLVGLIVAVVVVREKSRLGVNAARLPARLQPNSVRNTPVKSPARSQATTTWSCTPTNCMGVDCQKSGLVCAGSYPNPCECVLPGTGGGNSGGGSNPQGSCVGEYWCKKTKYGVIIGRVRLYCQTKPDYAACTGTATCPSGYSFETGGCKWSKTSGAPTSGFCQQFTTESSCNNSCGYHGRQVKCMWYRDLNKCNATETGC